MKTHKVWERNSCNFIRDFDVSYCLNLSFKHQNGLLKIKNFASSELEVRFCRRGMCPGDFIDKFSLKVGEEKTLVVGEIVFREAYWRKVK